MSMLNDLLAATRSISKQPQRELRGHPYALHDLFHDSKVERRSPSHISGSSFGVPVVEDDTLPEGRVEVRQDGSVIRVLIQFRGQWFAYDPSVLTVVPRSQDDT